MPNLNERLIQSLKAPQTKHKIYWDEKIIGLGFRITNNNAKSFVLRYVINGRERKYTIGNYPQLSTTAARDMATKLKGEIAKGNDPLEAKQANYKTPTFKDLAIEYIKTSQSTKRAKTISEYQSMLTNHILPKFGNQKLNSITKKDIEKLHNSLKEMPYRANRILQLLSSMFNLAISWDWMENNPAKDAKKFKEDRRHRFLSDNEIAKLIEALNQQQNKANANIIKLILLTGSRKGEVFSARWQDFDFENGVWIKPASLTKQNKTSHIPLNKEALQILEEMKKNIIKDENFTPSKEEQIISNQTYLFYNPRTKTHIGDIKRFWKNICQTAQIKNARIHDLRHTFASILVNSGIGLEVIGKLVGHSNAKTTQRYAHLINDTLKQATEVFGTRIGNIGLKREFVEVK
jgi:integrase